MPEITDQQLIDASTDATNYASVVNGAATDPNVVMRSGVSVPTLAKVATTMAKGDKGDTGASGSLATTTTQPILFEAPITVEQGIVLPTAMIGSYQTVENNVWEVQDQTGTRVVIGVDRNNNLIGVNSADNRVPNTQTTDGTNMTLTGGDAFTPSRTPAYQTVEGAIGGSILDATGQRFLAAFDVNGLPLPGPGGAPATTLGFAAPPLRFPYDAAAFTAGLNHVLFYGESMLVGTNTAAISTTNAPNARMFNSGVNAYTNGQSNSFVSLHEIGTETPATGFANALAARLANKYLSWPLFVSSAAVPGYTYAQLAGPTTAGGSGTVPFQELMSQVAVAKTLATGLMLPYSPRIVVVDLGVNDVDAGTTAAAFTADMLVWQADIQAGINAITGLNQTIKLAFVLSQYNLGLCQAQLVMAHPDLFTMVCAGYQIEHQSQAEITAGANAVHFSNYGLRNVGEYIASMVEREVLQNAAHQVPYPQSITVVGNQVIVNFRSETAMAIDTTWVTDPGDAGLAFSDTTNATIVSYSFTGPQQLTIVLDRVPSAAGTRTLSYATFGNNGPQQQQGPAYGLRGCLRNTSSKLSMFPDSSGALTPMHLYAAPFQFTI